MSEQNGPSDLVGTGRHLSASELFVWTRFLDASRLLEEMLATHLSREHEMNHSDYEVLVRLDGHGGRMRMADLAKQVVSSAQKLTHTANRLEQRGWITRETSGDDGRVVFTLLAEPGRSALAEAAYGHALLIRTFLLDPMTQVEQASIGTTMDRISAHLRTHRSGAACPDCSLEGEDRHRE